MLQLSVKVFIAQVARGGTETGKFNMTNLIVHSKRNHNKQHEDFHKTAEAKKQTSGSLQQPTQSKTFANCGRKKRHQLQEKRLANLFIE